MTGFTAAAAVYAAEYDSRMSVRGKTGEGRKSLYPDDEADELGRAGIDPEKMGYLSGRERRRILRRAGLDPDKFDF